jgi:hypothetical protein
VNEDLDSPTPLPEHGVEDGSEDVVMPSASVEEETVPYDCMDSAISYDRDAHNFLQRPNYCQNGINTHYIHNF